MAINIYNSGGFVPLILWDYGARTYAEPSDEGNETGYGLNDNWRAISDGLETLKTEQDNQSNEISDLQTNSHTHTNKTVLDNIITEGSGNIITNTERDKLNNIQNSFHFYSGKYIDTCFGINSVYFLEPSVSISVNFTAFNPIIVSKELNLNTIALNIKGISDNISSIKFAIYSDNDGYPYNRIGDIAEETTINVGLVETSFIRTLTTGIFWIAATIEGTGTVDIPLYVSQPQTSSTGILYYENAEDEQGIISLYNNDTNLPSTITSSLLGSFYKMKIVLGIA